MKKHLITPRKDYTKIVEAQGLIYHENYWKEDCYYTFLEREIEIIESATNELQEMCLYAVQYIIDNNLFDELKITKNVIPDIVDSWNNDVPSIYGRFDFAYDGITPKLLEYNADTPTSLLEASVIQWSWKVHVFPNNDQFNSIHESLIEKWIELKSYINRPLYFSCMKENTEDIMTTVYLLDTAIQAGIETEFIYIEDIGFDNIKGQFVDMNERSINSIFKLYPYEWLIKDEFGINVLETYNKMSWIEPIWKMIMSNKGFMVILSRLFPCHPNILKTSFDIRDIDGDYVKKPIFSREGANITIVKNGQEIITDGEYGEEGYIYQEYSPIPEFNNKTPIIGSWVVDSKSVGIGIRDGDIITDNRSNFVPHIITTI